MKKIGIIVGSLRSGSYSKMVANYLKTILDKDYAVSLIGVGGLPLYNEDIDHKDIVPSLYNEFRKLIKEQDAFIFVTPEYNRGIPGAMKNAIDVASRPYGENVWDNKKAAIVSQSPGSIGGFGAVVQLRPVLAVLNMPVMPSPEVYLSNVYLAFDENGNLINEKVKGILNDFVDAYKKFLE